VRLLLDTHVLLWWFNEPEVLTPESVEAISDEASVVYVSAVTIWEAAIKAALGKLRGTDDLVARVRAQRLDELAIELDHAAAAAVLPPHHTDPFDRMLVAQAQHEGLTLVTRDPRIGSYDVALLAA
jgi:PIN domain nuclease of toxin-antitoxin system